jgi:hypothetical protein
MILDSPMSFAESACRFNSRAARKLERRFLEPFSLLVAQLAYDGSDGPEPAYRFARFRKHM